MKKMLLSVMAAVLTIVGMSNIAMMSPAYADNIADQYLTGENSVNPGIPGQTEDDSLMSIIKNIINAVIGLVGVAAVLMMIIGGVSFITSQGDANKVTKARNTILYGVVGLIIALLSFAIVNFVLGEVFNASGVWLF